MVLITNFQMALQGQYISHLQYADDIILFLQEGEEQLYTIRPMLELLQDISGLQINSEKSQGLGVNMEQRAVRRAAAILGCHVGKFPITYLELPLTLDSVRCRD